MAHESGNKSDHCRLSTGAQAKGGAIQLRHKQGVVYVAQQSPKVIGVGTNTLVQRVVMGRTVQKGRVCTSTQDRKKRSWLNTISKRGRGSHFWTM